MKTIVFNSIQVTNYWFTPHRALRPLYQQAQTFSPYIQGILDQNVTLINQLQHVYNDSESKKKATHTLKTLKQMRKSFARHLTTFEQTLLKAEGLK